MPRKRKLKFEIEIDTVKCFSETASNIRIGTSGFSYKHWREPGSYYADVPQKLEWQVYSQEFNFLELNATFYGWFQETVFDGWRNRAASTRDSFLYAVKVSQMYTHKKKLIIDDFFIESWHKWWAKCERLKPHLGPVLWQFPSNFKTTSKQGVASNIDRLRSLGKVLPKGEKFAFEFRDSSWFCPEVYEIMKENDWALVVSVVHGGWAGDLVDGPNPALEEFSRIDACSWGVYLRFHGSQGQYRGMYGCESMDSWAELIRGWSDTGRAVYIAFNNDNLISTDDKMPAAIADCRHLATALRNKGAIELGSEKEAVGPF